MKIMTVTAHPDDLELHMGGTLALLKEQGVEVYAIIMANGYRSPKERSREENIKTRRKEASAALKNYVKKLIFLDIEDDNVSYSDENLKKLSVLFEDIYPDYVFTHNLNDYHTDHCITAQLIKHIASFKAPLIHFDTINGSHKEPSFFIDITATIVKKKKALELHKSQAYLNLVALAWVLSNYRGLQYTSDPNRFAEAFFYDHPCYRKSVTNLVCFLEGKNV